MSLENIVEQIKITKGIPDIIAFSAGAYKGYCDSQGIHINSELINVSLKFVPTALYAGLGAYFGLAEGISDEDNESYAPFVIRRGIYGGVVGATETGLGYCIGYTTGSLCK